MKPIKTLFPLSIWLMRLAVLFFVIMSYWETFAFFNFKSVLFYVSFIFILSAIFLFIGGFLKKDRLTVISSIVLILVTGYHAFLNMKSGIDHNFAVFVVLGSIFVYFLATGNNRK